MLSGLGTMLVDIAYIAAVVIFGINLAKRDAFHQLINKAGEDDKTQGQISNVIGIAIYLIIAFLLLLLLNNAAGKIFGKINL